MALFELKKLQYLHKHVIVSYLKICHDINHIHYLIGAKFLSDYKRDREFEVEHFGPDDAPIFKPKRVVVLSRITRYEFEKLRFSKISPISEENLRKKLHRRRSDYNTLLERHQTHYSCVQHMKNRLENYGIEVKIVTRPDFTTELIDWADAVFTAGGDGTFLGAASKILSREKPLIGINSDPARSEGRLCLPKELCSPTHFDCILQRLLSQDFRWKWRQRIRITMSGKHMNDAPIELQNQQLKHLEHRYTEHMQELKECIIPPTTDANHVRVLPVRALNEVFMGESLSSRVSYYEMSVDGKQEIKQKSSGVTVCTGTGSTSWHFHINKFPNEAISNILEIAGKLASVSYPTNEHFVQTVADSFNNSLIFDPSESYMGYTVRDPITNDIYKVYTTRGKAKKIQVISRMWDACLVVDGGCSFYFNDGAIATLEIFDEDALRTVDFS